jgi:S1-C subfamily serine protease
MQRESGKIAGHPLAVLEHLTGASRGKATWLADPSLNVILRRGRLIDVTADDASQDDGELVARLTRAGDTFEIEAVDGQPIWINGQLTQHARLRHHDTVEFGERGPVSRLRVYRDSEPPTIGVADILSDTAAYLRSSRKPLARRLVSAASQIGGRLARETTLLFRLGVIAALLLIGFLAWQQSRINALMRERIETGTAQLQSYSKLLAEVRKDALTPADLAKLREELSGRVATAAERIAELEQRSSAVARVIEQARPSILFLQGSYAFREVASGRMLRHVVGPQGEPLVLPNGLPLLSLSGSGPVAERQFTGTGFVVGDGVIVTSRHVGQPWLYDTNVKALAGNGLEPVPIRFLAYFTDGGGAHEISIAGVSEVADVALLRLKIPVPGLTGLKLADRVPRPGDDVILIGYPAGIRSMVAHAGAKFIEQLKQDDVSDFWKIAARLSEERRILPLASRGIVARISQESIVYDAETTYGGSGGPVLNSDGAVVAVNSAIIPEYGGANFGVPAAELRRLLEDAKSN